MNWDDLNDGPPLDAVVIGGGINGSAIAAELAHAGLRVALFEKDDFGFGTTWRSSKMIHGGLRYLEHFELPLVFESLRERAWLLKTKPHLVRPMRFVLPMLPWTRRPRWQLRAGLTLYDTLALRRDLPRHRGASPRTISRAFPAMTADQDGGFVYSDAMAVSPERLALESALEAEAAGAFVANHAEVTGIESSAGRVTAVTVERGGETIATATNAVVNAAGPWVDSVNRLLSRPPAELLGVTKGTHVMLDLGEAPSSFAVTTTAKSDGRVIFAIPRDGMLLVGTTDDRFEADPSSVRPDLADIDYLLAEADELFPAYGLGRDSVRYAYAGLRPLLRSTGGAEAAITRKHQVVDHSRAGGPAGLLSIAGGKLSTARPLAGEVLKRLGHGRPTTRASTAPSEGLTTGDSIGRLSIYGVGVAKITRLGEKALCEHSGLLAGEVVHSLRNERAETLSDVLMRRTGASWASCRGLCNVDAVAAVAAGEASWDAKRLDLMVQAFREDVCTHLPTPAELEQPSR